MKNQRVLIFLVILVLLVRAGYYFAQPDVCTDHISQMAMAHNFMDGNGFSFKFIDAQQQVYYKTHIQWPPLYPFLLALVSFITANTLLSSFIIQIAVLLFLVIIWRKIFNLFKNLVAEEAYFYFISFLIISTSILNNINTILVVALLILSLSIYFLFAYLFLDKSRKLNLFLSSLFASLLFWTHYSYFLTAFYPAVVLFVIFYTGRDKAYFFASLNAFFTSLVFASGVLIYNYLSTGLINYMDNPGIWKAGFFPEHLRLTDPFFVNAFFNTGYLPANLFFFSKNYHGFLTLLFQIASFIILLVIAFLFLRIRKSKSVISNSTSLLFIPFFVIIVLTISFLLYFTLHYHEIPIPGWTHLGDSRYLSSVYLSIITIFILFLFVKVEYIKPRLVKIFKVVLFAFILVSLCINIYLAAGHWGKYSFINNNKAERDYEKLFDNLKLELSEGKVPVFVKNDLTVLSFRMSQYAGTAGISLNELNRMKKIPSNMVFFFILPETKNYRDVDFQLRKWSERFNLVNLGVVDTKFTLYKVNNPEY